jgi:glycosyltransferase involved in cell wall biosynthesis
MRPGWPIQAGQLNFRRPGAAAGGRGRASELPLVSVILTTRDRPRLLRIALACYRQQTYPRRELIVVDDGDRFPADAEAIRALGGRLVRVEPGTPLGTKLNRGAAEARGRLCEKMDDDDWYGPGFLQTMVAALQASRTSVCRPTVAFLMPFLLFDIARWEVRQSLANGVPAATLLFAREDWQEHPFRALSRDEDVWFYDDQLRAGVRQLPVRAPETYLAVRHSGSGTDRGHTWTRQRDGQVVEEYFRTRPLHPGGPESLLPGWALAAYRDLRRDLLAGRA